MDNNKQVIIGFMGNIGSGKTYLATQLHQYYIVSSYMTNFAKAIKSIAFAGHITKDGKKVKIYANEDELFDRMVTETRKLVPEEIAVKMYSNPEKCYTLKQLIKRYINSVSTENRMLIARNIFQFIGTEMGRECGGKDIWVNALIDDINEHARNKKVIIIDDVRFINEFRFIKDNNGYIIKITGNRPVDTSHKSESEQLSIDPSEIDKTFVNTYTIVTVREVLEYAKTKLNERLLKK